MKRKNKLHKIIKPTMLIFLFLVCSLISTNLISGKIEGKGYSFLDNVLGTKEVYAVNRKSDEKDKLKVYLGGSPLGIKLNTEGVLVVGLSDVKTEKGEDISPGAMAGIEIGDSIIKVNNKEILSAEDLSEMININKGEKLNILVRHKEEVQERVLTPIKSSDNKFKIGLWVRDCTTGIGTLSFYEETSNIYGALGHAITDVDTGNLMTVRDGKIVSSNIISVKKGEKGNPGELKGIFVDDTNKLGNIEKNNECGIFGVANEEILNKIGEPIEIALKDEVKVGKAEIVTTVDGKTPERYEVMVEKVLRQDESNSKSMVIKIVDERLLNKTGGIVQGMSGSPIIQDGKLIGAVTHVLVNKPEVGYGVYIEWMLKEAEILK